MLRVGLSFGTRPEAIKMAPLVKRLMKEKDIKCIVCVTAQHREMLDQVLRQFEILPDYDLNIMQNKQTLSSVTARVLEGMDYVIKESKPDLLLVHGDTTTTYAASLAAFYNNIPVGHVEAGLRSFDMHSPFPEEINRVMTARIADLHFAPTKSNKKNLAEEGIIDGIFVTGNTVIDALIRLVSDELSFKDPVLNELCSRSDEKLIVLTAHRRENLGKPIENICNAVKRLTKENKDIRFVYPVHLNPAVRDTVFSVLDGVDRVHLIEPIEVRDMHNLINNCYMVMTDSGGLQEEAPALGKPVVVLRTETERPEVCEAGKAVLSGVEEQDIYEAADAIINNTDVYHKMLNAKNPYGDGRAAERIVQAIRFWAKLTDEKPEDFSLDH